VPSGWVDLLSAPLWPAKCALCRQLGESALFLCGECRTELATIAAPKVPVPAGLDEIQALYRHEGRARQAIHELKFNRLTAIAAAMSDDLARSCALSSADVFIPVPIHWHRRAWRGFNQAELLAAQLPSFQPKLLRRVRATRPQVGLSREARLRNLAGAFHADPAVSGLDVVLVDDVMTSGGTAIECARTLRQAGAHSVRLLVYAAAENG